MIRRTDRQTDRRQMIRRTDRQETDDQEDRQETDRRQMIRRTDRWTGDRWTDGRTSTSLFFLDTLFFWSFSGCGAARLTGGLEDQSVC